ncbi:putative mucin TcMUCII [Trypanosoma cruzi]|uniref:Putative mucin TcMUCII n=1 Tax=Trypanosoma cruzi TaxID=5693 RepID=A0A2V2VXU9_TRYCR|nr:putative mucin TcMUCII [Trypanosoma cruzi]
MTTLTMVTCRLLHALLVLALCCCPSVCVTASGDQKQAEQETTTTTTTTKATNYNDHDNNKATNYDDHYHNEATNHDHDHYHNHHDHCAGRHQALRLQRRQIRRPPVRRQVFAELTAASAALRGRVPRCFSPHPRWRTPLWAEEVCAGCACQHSATGTCARLPWSDV